MRIAEVVSVAPHPKADRLQVCQVDAGGMAAVKVVTNAQNVEEGMKVVFAVSQAAATVAGVGSVVGMAGCSPEDGVGANAAGAAGNALHCNACGQS
jgi:phenylalanyl-tRNA synthetase beta chain